MAQSRYCRRLGNQMMKDWDSFEILVNGDMSMGWVRSSPSYRTLHPIFDQLRRLSHISADHGQLQASSSNWPREHCHT